MAVWGFVKANPLGYRERGDVPNRARGNHMTPPKLNEAMQRKVVRLMCGTTKASGGAQVRKESIRGCRKRL